MWTNMKQNISKIVFWIYIFLHIPLLIIFIWFIAKSQFWNDFNVHTYQVRCSKNGKLVVSFGTIDNSPYTFSGKLITNSFWEERKDLKFYCNNYDEIQKYIENYKNAKSINEKTDINLSYLSFKKNAPMTNEQNYTLRVVDTKTDFTSLFIGIKNALIYMFIYFIMLQVVKIIFQYILSRKIIWYPYKGFK